MHCPLLPHHTCKRDFARVLRHRALLSAPLIAHRARSRTSLSRGSPGALTNSNLSHQRKKDTDWCPFRWRRRRDLNSRAGYIRPTPLAGAPLRPLEYFSKYPRELPLPFRSRPIIIYDFSRFVKCFWAKILFICKIIIYPLHFFLCML